MAFEAGYQNWINTNSDREAEFYAEALGINLKGTNFEHQGINKKCQIINNFLYELHNYPKQKELVKDIKLLYKNSKIEDTDWFWLNSDMSREINWMWGFIKINLKNNNPNTTYSLELFHNNLNISELEDNASSTTVKFHQLLLAFEKTNTSIKTLREISNNLLNIWNEISKDKGLIKYLDKDNNEQCEWTINYLTSQHACLDIFKHFIPLSIKDNYWYSIAIFDLIEDIRDKQLILLKMRKAWTQHKYRNKQNGKKSYSISMSPDTKRKLDDIVIYKDGKICDSIERLVSEEYERLFK